MLDVAAVRAVFPALAEPLVEFQNPAGRQIARQSFGRIDDYLVNANVGFHTAPSRATGAEIDALGDAPEAFAGAP